MKKIIIINGSPRKEGNSNTIAATLAKQIVDVGNQAEIFTISDSKIGPCIACEYCKSNDVCVQKDDATKLLAELKEAAGAVFIAPIYFGNIPGACKVLTDRFYSVFNPAKGMATADPTRKMAMVFNSGGTPAEALGPAEGLVKSCFALTGFGDYKSLFFTGQNQKDSFTKNAEYQKQISDLCNWLSQ